MLKSYWEWEPSPLIPALREIAIFVLKTKFYLLFCTRLQELFDFILHHLMKTSAFPFEILSEFRLNSKLDFIGLQKFMCIFHYRQYSSNQITKNEPKSDNCQSKFDCHDLSPICLTIMLLHNLKVFQKPIKHNLLVIQ